MLGKGLEKTTKHVWMVTLLKYSLTFFSLCFSVHTFYHNVSRTQVSYFSCFIILQPFKSEVFYPLSVREILGHHCLK